jgi:hypothetical protein
MPAATPSRSPKMADPATRMAETRVDRDNQYLINVWQNLLQHSRWSSWVDHHAGAFAERFNALYGTMQVSVAFPMNEK